MSENATPKSGPPATGEEFVISREFDAPRELLFQVWTETNHLNHWWGPKGFTVRTARNDLRPGGTFQYCLLTPDGNEVWGLWVYREVTRPERMVFVSSFSDESGNVVRHPFSAGWPLELLSTVTFEERDEKTLVTVRWSPIKASEAELKLFRDMHTSMKGGWTGTFDQLEAYLAKVPKGE